MKQVQVLNLSTPLTVDLSAGWCSSFWCKFKGLMLRRSIPENWGLLFVESKESITNTSIHMLFCFIDLGIVWMNSSGEVVDTCLARKWVTIRAPKSPARYFLEVLPSRLTEFKVGDRIKFVEQED
jgi:uncharacterized membrane protein (UPF0127 family)